LRSNIFLDRFTLPPNHVLPTTAIEPVYMVNTTRNVFGTRNLWFTADLTDPKTFLEREVHVVNDRSNDYLILDYRLRTLGEGGVCFCLDYYRIHDRP
jgi:hypothetical protein